MIPASQWLFRSDQIRAGHEQQAMGIEAQQMSQAGQSIQNTGQAMQRQNMFDEQQELSARGLEADIMFKQQEAQRRDIETGMHVIESQLRQEEAAKRMSAIYGKIGVENQMLDLKAKRASLLLTEARVETETEKLNKLRNPDISKMGRFKSDGPWVGTRGPGGGFMWPMTKGNKVELTELPEGDPRSKRVEEMIAERALRALGDIGEAKNTDLTTGKAAPSQVRDMQKKAFNKAFGKFGMSFEDLVSDEPDDETGAAPAAPSGFKYRPASSRDENMMVEYFNQRGNDGAGKRRLDYIKPLMQKHGKEVTFGVLSGIINSSMIHLMRKDPRVVEHIMANPQFMAAERAKILNRIVVKYSQDAAFAEELGRMARAARKGK